MHDNAPDLIHVVVLDSTRMGTQLLCKSLSRERKFKVVPASSDPHNTDNLALRANPDVLIISSTVGGQPGKGYEIARQIQTANPKLRMLALLDESNRERVLEAFRAGARGVFSRNDSLKPLAKCVLSVYRGQVWANNEQLEYLLEALSEPVPMRLVDAKGAPLLTTREQGVVRCVTEGLTNREIADRLQLSEHTVKNYISHIFEKLGISSRVELFLYVLAQLGPKASGADSAPSAGLFTNDTVIANWCREAAEHCSVAPFTLAEMHREGRGVPQDETAAYMWLHVAEAVIADVQDKSRIARRNLESTMAPEDVKQARKRAEEWLNTHYQYQSSKPVLISKGPSAVSRAV
jgi:two-component system nitrate/nitrite response regulator NarL